MITIHHVYVCTCMCVHVYWYTIYQSLKCLEGMRECKMCVRVNAGLSMVCWDHSGSVGVGVGEQIRQSLLHQPAHPSPSSLHQLRFSNVRWCQPTTRYESKLGCTRIQKLLGFGPTPAKVKTAQKFGVIGVFLGWNRWKSCVFLRFFWRKTGILTAGYADFYWLDLRDFLLTELKD